MGVNLSKICKLAANSHIMKKFVPIICILTVNIILQFFALDCNLLASNEQF